MPQLIPEPWFFIFLISWLILLLVSPSKIINYLNLNKPNSKLSKVSNNSWTWPWQ
uniref:ATP synthase complex subunit 8 n=1 Tax=Zhangixalus dennysi TaxID=3136583 RepID=A0A0H3UQG9_9NEOB|nr:ATP synthase F0 subunit 8 [Rhacophorus dennysi]AIU99182.1 ATP synthase F0 subunit 8 [Rhacophorus dennysi]ARO35602.1 ATP synthase F0 subunit 8 [Rhacophorus dennysi]UAJ48176.1 ATP synthase F0 subunit 8 [Rhacophorus sp.]